jgi:ABC-2 type transport system permease protein
MTVRALHTRRLARRPPDRWSALAWRQYRLERRTFWRNPSAAFFNFLLPLLLLGIFGAILAGDRESLSVIVPGIAGMSIMATTFTALALNLTFLREQGILKRMRGTPLPPSAHLAGMTGSAVTNAILQVVIITAAGHALFNLAWPDRPLSMMVFVALGVVCFGSLGIALSHAIPNFESAPAYTNAVFLPAIMISGVFYKLTDAPQLVGAAAEALPLKHLVDGLAGAMVRGEGIAQHGIAVVLLGAWAAIGLLLAVRGFSWEARSA